MAKITKKKEVGIEELINKISKKEVRGYKFEGSKSAVVKVDLLGYIDITWLQEGETFEIEIEQKIDENTKLKNLVELYSYGSGKVLVYWNKPISIKEVIRRNDNGSPETLAFYVMNDNCTMQLIWKDGKFVEH